jgi:hypothetical protein
MPLLLLLLLLLLLRRRRRLGIAQWLFWVLLNFH